MLIALLVFICCIPTFLAHEIYERLDNNNTIEKLYSIGFSSVFLNDGCALLKFNLWLTGSVLKAAPCFLLVVLTFALLKRLRGNEKKRRERFFKLVEKTNSVVKQTQSTASARRCAAADRTTYVLLLMLCVFLLTELPQGLFAILNAIRRLDLLSLINCYVAFTVYMLTSSTYRETLLGIFVTISTRKKYGSVYLRNNNHTPLVNRLSTRQKAENNKKTEENNEEKLALNNGFA
uniref:G-protein coupled receptors family 1 profile domain-containing protein n=1 Tax=Ditylenchus dipsaci TaxID=166011 RepID=A0A915CW08_9BILA